MASRLATRIGLPEIKRHPFRWLTISFCWMTVMLFADTDFGTEAWSVDLSWLPVIVAMLGGGVAAHLVVVWIGPWLSARIGVDRQAVMVRVTVLHLPLSLLWLSLWDGNPVSGWTAKQLIPVLVLGLLSLALFERTRESRLATSLARRGAWVALVAGLALFVALLGSESWNAPVSDRARFAGDTWEYQSIAVNLAYGHCFPCAGGIEPFAAYRFDDTVDAGRDHAEMRREFEVTGELGKLGGRQFYRTPVYPAVLAFAYRILGVAPGAAKRLQLVALACVAALLPWLGFLLWRGTGVVAGLAAGWMTFETFHRFARLLSTEVVVTLAILACILAHLAWRRRPGWITSSVLGIALGGAVLTKGTLIFLPLLFALVHLWPRSSHPVRSKLRVGVVVVSLAVVSLWSGWASWHAGHPVLVSSQGSAVLLDGNNEYTLEGGGWRPEWRRDPAVLYNQTGLSQASTLVKLATFYGQHALDVPLIVSNKIRAGFNPFPYLRIAILFALLTSLGRLALALCERLKNRPSTQIVSALTAGVCALSLVTLVYVILWPHNFELAFLPQGFGNIDSLLLVIGVLVVVSHILRVPWWDSGVPPFFVMVAGNFLLVTLVTFGLYRLIAPVGFLFLLCGVRSLLVLGAELLDAVERSIDSAADKAT